jgi:hypothetical protein
MGRAVGSMGKATSSQGGIKYFTSLEDSLTFFKISPETA